MGLFRRARHRPAVRSLHPSKVPASYFASAVSAELNSGANRTLLDMTQGNEFTPIMQNDLNIVIPCVDAEDEGMDSSNVSSVVDWLRRGLSSRL